MAAQHTATKRFFAKAIVLAAIVMVVLVALTATVGTTLAYFTTYATAKGYVEVSLEEQTQIKEDFSQWTKHLTIANQGENSRPVYVRAKAFGGEQYTLTYSGSGWSQNADGYYYYGSILNPGDTANVLDVKIDGIPKDAVDFNVIVVYETTPVIYDANGNPSADWNNILDNGNLSEGGDQ